MTNQINKLEAEDTLIGLIKFKSGCMATVELTTAARPKILKLQSLLSEKKV